MRLSQEKVNLFVVGAARSGTSFIHSYLMGHPEVFMSRVKEPHYFSSCEVKDKSAYGIILPNLIYHTRVVRKLEQYDSLFEDSLNTNYKYRGESSPSYLVDAESAGRIYEYNSNSKIVMILRHPVDRVISHYNIDKLFLKKSLYDLALSDKNSFNFDYSNINWLDDLFLIFAPGFYSSQIESYLKYFGSDQVLILSFDELKNNTELTINKLTTFLNIDNLPLAKSNSINMNSSSEFKSSMISSIYVKLKKNIPNLYNFMDYSLPKGLRNYLIRRLKIKSAHIVSDECIKELNEIYSKEIETLKLKYNIVFEKY